MAASTFACLEPSIHRLISPLISTPNQDLQTRQICNMASLEDLDDLEQNEKKDEQSGDKDGDGGDGKKPSQNGDADMKDTDASKKEDENKEEEEELIDMEILNSSTRDIVARRRLIENDTRIMKSEFNRLNHEKQAMNEKIKDNVDKIENNR